MRQKKAVTRELRDRYQRSDIEDEIKMKLKSQYAMLNPAELKRKITKLQNRLLKLNALKQKVREDLVEKSVEPSSRFEYIST